jgi:predicted nucleotidyltransferase component of viral defense system
MGANGYVRTGDDLRDIAERVGRPLAEIEQDFLLVMIAAQLQADYPNQLCFKGGFVLHHAYGTERLSFDVDSTRTAPARHKLDAAAVAHSIRTAGRPLYRIPAIAPATNSKNSLDFDAVKYVGPISRGQVEVEISYREEVCLEPLAMPVGPPYADAVMIPTMVPSEMLAEKHRTLCQRTRPTDLLDAADLWDGVAGLITAENVAELIPKKFADGIVKGGNHANRIRGNVEAMEATYESTIRARAPNAMQYERAAHLVISHLAAVFRK